MGNPDRKALRVIFLRARYKSILYEIEKMSEGVYKLYYSDENDKTCNGTILINIDTIRGLRLFLEEINIV